MKNRIIALVGALVLLLTFFTACGNDGAQTGDKPQQKNEPQLVVATNPVFVYDSGTMAVAYNDMNTAMTRDSGNSSLTAITDSAWSLSTAEEDAWTRRAVYGFGNWKSGSGAKAKGAFAYAFNEAGNISLGVYNKNKLELVTYQDEEIPDVGVLLSATAGEEEALVYTATQDGTVTIPAGTMTAIEQVVGVKTGFLAEDGTARSASVRIMFNDLQVYSGTMCNSTAAEDGVAVTQLSYPQINDLPVKAGDMILFSIKLEAQANSDEDVTPAEPDEGHWQVVKASRTVPKDNNKGDSDVTSADGSIPMVADYQFTFTIVRDKAHDEIASSFMNTVMRRTGCEIFGHFGDQDAKYEIVIGNMAARPTSGEIYKELTTARADNADDYIIRLVGTKIYIVGANDNALKKAIDYFTETFVKDDKGKIPAKYDYYHKPTHVMYMVAGQNIASYTIRVERYPSYVVQMAAEAIQNAVLADCGYILPIKNMNLAGTDVGTNEIRVGPMNGAVKVTRQYDTYFNSTNWQSYMSIAPNGMLPGDHGDYRVRVDGKSVAVEGGSEYAVNIGAAKLIADLKAAKTLAASYSASGNYQSGYDYKNGTGYDTVKYDMIDGFGLVYAEEFDYTGTDAEKEKGVKKKWNIDSDNSMCADDPDLNQYRYGVYGDTWWVAADTAGNNYLFEVTKKRVAGRESNSDGFDSVRLSTSGQWGFRFGVGEVRVVSALRNGACSAVWSTTGAPYSNSAHWGEIDWYENYGQDMFLPMLHANNGSHYYGAGMFQGWQEKGYVTPNEGEHLYDTFHTLSVVWTYDYLDIYVDGKSVTHTPLTTGDVSTAFRTGTNIKLANGIGQPSYCQMVDPWKGYDRQRESRTVKFWMDDITQFFEAQVVDYVRVYQTSNDDIEFVNAENNIQFSKKFVKANS